MRVLCLREVSAVVGISGGVRSGGLFYGVTQRELGLSGEGVLLGTCCWDSIMASLLVYIELVKIQFSILIRTCQETEQ